MTANRKDIVAGAIFVAVGAFVGIEALFSLNIGTARQMGPGYFPVVLGILLSVLGVVIFLQSLGHTTRPWGGVSWRAVLLIGSVPIIFGLTVRGLGFAPAIMMAAMISAFASKRVWWPAAIVVSAAITVLCILIFSIGIGLPFRLLGPWLGG